MSEYAKKKHPGKEKNRISITIRHGGQAVELEFNIHQKIKVVLEKTLKEFEERFGLVPPPNNISYLRYGTVDLSDPEKTLEDYEIPDKAVLDLLFRSGGG